MQELNSRLNVIVGNNARGKTTVLESLRLITSLQSFRTSKISEMIQEGKAQASVSAQFVQPTASKVVVGLEASRKSFQIDGQKSTRSKYPALGGSVSFIPDDLYLVKGSPEARRNFIDDLGMSLDSGYSEILQRYTKTLKQRNQVLKAIKKAGSLGRTTSATLDYGVWTEALVEAAAPLFEARVRLMDDLAEHLPGIYANLFNVNEKVSSVYQHQFVEKWGRTPDFRQAMYERLGQLVEAESAMGYSLAGPHRDDFRLQIDGRDATHFASQGQIRGLVIALKITQLEMSRNTRKFAPILLLDDIISELDDHRVQALVSYLSAYPGQLFVTTAEVAKVTTLHQEFSGFKLIPLDQLEAQKSSIFEPSESGLNTEKFPLF